MTDTVDVPIVADALPAYAHPGDAGADLCAAEAVTLAPGERAHGADGRLDRAARRLRRLRRSAQRPRRQHGITIVNSPGTVDAGYRGEIRVTVLNTDSSMPYDIAVGDRIAQLIVMPVTRARFVPVESLPESHRGAAGFGSTGYTVDAVRRTRVSDTTLAPIPRSGRSRRRRTARPRARSTRAKPIPCVRTSTSAG